ncbi:MAG TPA: hypothetical protein ENJ27_02385, partial [Candidatus Moranbacteria bacterium]|nr:hypothetical protein [Candidatus Moranbacteria bacterium]
MKVKIKNIYPKITVLILMLIFFSFGFFHLTKFETVDEHFWKDKRIKKYWRGIELGFTKGHWKKTRINDKPGVTVAIVSGTGLLFEPNPETNRLRDSNITQDGLYTVYNSNRTEKINLTFRLPLLLFNTFFFLILFWLLLKIIPPPYALIATIFIATSPILIGISQIINPDTLLWTFFTGALLSYFALLKNNQKKFLWLTILFTGLALLSKYTANIIFPLFVFIFLIKIFIDYRKTNNRSFDFSKYLKKYIFNWFAILAGAILIYGIIMPASLEKTKHLWNGTINSPALAPIFWPLIFFLILLLLETIFLKNNFSKKIIKFLQRYKQLIFKLTSLIALTLFLFILINPLLPNPIIPLINVKENAFVDKELLFPMLDGHSLLAKTIIKLAIEAGPFVFSLSPIIIFLLLALWTRIIFKGLHNNQLLVFFITFFIPTYFAMLLFVGVLANPRYSIVLYPLIAILSALSIQEFFPDLRKKLSKQIIIVIILIISGLFSLWNIKPFYLNYENFLLPQKYILTDAWGYGEYEAAQYLNSLPNPEKITIWSDRSAICQFIKGKCIRNYKIDLSKTIPDYLVFSRRGSIRHKFEWEKENLAPHNIFYYYKQKPIWEIQIGRR